LRRMRRGLPGCDATVPQRPLHRRPLIAGP
jgi:hypothetical protein